MHKLIRRFSKKCFENLAELEQETYCLPSKLITILQIQQSLLDLTYLDRKEGGYIFMLSIFVRPQLYFNTDIIQYIQYALHFIYFVAIFVKLPYRKFFSLHGIMMRTSYLNFSLEIANNTLCYFNQPLTIIISTLNQFILLEALDVKIKNFQQIKVRIIFHLILLLQITISLLNFYSVEKKFIYFCIVVHQIFMWIHSQNFIEKSIHIYTVFITFCELLQISEQSSFIIIFPLFCRIHQKMLSQQIGIQEYLPNETDSKNKIIYISQLMAHKQYLKSLQLLSNLQFTNIILNIKKEFLKKRCIQEVYHNIKGNSQTKINMIESHQQIILSEERFIKMSKKLKSLLKEKIALLLNYKLEQFSQFFEFLERMDLFEQQILLMQQDHPSHKLRKIILFYYAEIQNNFHQARLNTIQNNNFQFEEQEKQKVCYIISVYNTELQITGVSKNNIFSKNDLPFSLEQCIPPGIREFHKKMVEEFIQNGKSKIVERFSQIFMVKEYEKMMTSVEIGLLINATDKLQFISFFQPSIELKLAMILNSFYQITCISEQLANVLSISFFDQKHIGFNIKNFIPNFQENQTYQEELDLIITQDQEEAYYVVTINLMTRIIDNEVLYLILYFQSIRRTIKQKVLNLNLKQSIFDPTSLNFETKRFTDEDVADNYRIAEEDIVYLPYENQSEHQISIQCINRDDRIDDNLVVESPISYQQKLINKPTLTSKLRKQLSQNIEDQNCCSKILIKQGELEKKDFIHKFYQQKINSIKKFYISFIICLFIACLFFIFQTIKINQDIQSLIQDIDILDFAQLSFQPLENNLLILFSLSEYQLYYLKKMITQQQYQNFIKFPSQQVIFGYQEIFNNFNFLFDQSIFQEILDENTIEIYQYTNSTNNDTYEVTLRKAFGLLLEFQYDSLVDFLKNGKISSDTSHIFYLFKNYLPLKLLVTDLNNQLLDKTIIITQRNKDFSKNFLIISLSIITIPYIISIIYMIKITNLIDHYYNILLQLSENEREAQVQVYKYFLNQLNQDYDFVLKYRYSEIKLKNERNRLNQKRTKLTNTLKHPNFYWKIGYILLFSLLTIKSGILFYISNQYFQGYNEIAEFYISLSDLSISISSMYSAREVIYFRASFPYLQNDTIEYLLSMIEEGLNKTQKFLETEAIQAMIENLIITNQFEEYYDTVLQDNLCELLNENIKQQTQSICEQVFNGNMKKGLISVLTGMLNNLKSELSFNKFSQRQSINFYDLEGAFLISQIISSLFHKMREDLLTETVLLVDLMNITSIVQLSLFATIIFFSKELIYNKVEKKLEICKKFLSFIPIKMLLIEESMERNIKNLMYKSNMH